MGRVSRRKIHPEIEGRVYEIFREYLANLKNSQDIQEFLINLLSSTEQVMLSKRLAIAVLLSKGFTYEEIDQTLKVSKSTIGTIHKQILIGSPGYKKAINHILNQEKLEKVGNTIEEIILKLTPPKKHGSEGWENKSRLGKDLISRKRRLVV